MATAAFKSTTKRTPMGASSTSSADDSSSSNRNSSAYRRSRSLSRFARRIVVGDTFNEVDEFPPRREKFVNTVRGSGFPEISLDDLAIELFESGNRGRLASRHSEVSPTSASAIAASQSRGRSLSRKSSGVSNDGRGNVGAVSSGGEKAVSETNARRRRSVSVLRYQISDSESDLEHSQNSQSYLKSADIGNKQMHKPAFSDKRPVLRKSLSQKDVKSYDGYSSHSSVLTDDEGAGAYFSKNGVETIGAVYAQKKAMLPNTENGWNKAMRKELRHAEEDVKLEKEQAVVKSRTSCLPSGDRSRSKSSDVIQTDCSIRRNYESKLEQSEKRKHDLLAEIVREEQHGRELSKIVKELLPDTKNNAVEKPSKTRKRSNDRNRMSRCLTEEAERIIEDFISNVEDTDVSSFDGERSETSSSIGGVFKPETFNTPPVARSLPAEMDGVAFPWLQWEISNDLSPSTCLNMTKTLAAPKTAHSIQEIANAQDQTKYSASSRGSWSPDVKKDLISEFGESSICRSESFSAESKGLRYDMDEYLKLKSNEDFVIETWRRRQRINSGSLHLCNLKLF